MAKFLTRPPLCAKMSGFVRLSSDKMTTSDAKDALGSGTNFCRFVLTSMALLPYSQSKQKVIAQSLLTLLLPWQKSLHVKRDTPLPRRNRPSPSRLHCRKWLLRSQSRCNSGTTWKNCLLLRKQLQAVLLDLPPPVVQLIMTKTTLVACRVQDCWEKNF